MATSPTLMHALRDKVRPIHPTVKTEDMERAILAAVRRYSKDRPKRRTTLMSGTASGYVTIPTALAQSIRFFGEVAACIHEIEYPIGNRPPEFLRPGEDWRPYPPFVSSPSQIVFLDDVPASGTNNIRVYHNAIHLPVIESPSGVTLTVNGTAATTSYSYRVSSLDDFGETIPGTAVTDATGPATLNGTDYIQIDWTENEDAVGGYRIYRSASAGTPATTGLIGEVAAGTTTLDDTGLTVTDAVIPSTNTAEGTINVIDLEPVGCLAAYLKCLEIAGSHAANVAQDLDADAVDWGGMHPRHIASANAWWEAYINHIARTTPPRAASFVVRSYRRDAPHGRPIFRSQDKPERVL